MAQICPRIPPLAKVSVMSVISLAFGIAGCSPKRPQVYPVHGEVFWEGKPAVGALVYLHPCNDAPSNETPAKQSRPMGRVKADGSFDVSTYGTNDGAPIGRYRISLVWTESIAPGSSEEVDLIPPEYANPATAPLEPIEIRAEKNVLAPLRLSR